MTLVIWCSGVDAKFNEFMQKIDKMVLSILSSSLKNTEIAGDSDERIEKK